MAKTADGEGLAHPRKQRAILKGDISWELMNTYID